MRQADKKYFGDIQQGRLNSDDSAFVVGSNEWINAENIRTGSTDKGVTGIVESVGGNTKIDEPNAIGSFYLNIEQNPQGKYILSQTKSNTHTSAIATWDIGNTMPPIGTQIQGSIDDPSFGIIGIVNYVVKSTDINIYILAKSLSNNINLSSLIYGYTSLCVNNIITIYSRQDAGTILNGLSIQNINIGTITPFSNGIVNNIIVNNSNINWVTNQGVFNNSKISSGVFNIKSTISHSSTTTPIITVFVYAIYNNSYYTLGTITKNLQYNNLTTYDFNIDIQQSISYIDYIEIVFDIQNVSNGNVLVYPQSAEIINKKELYSYGVTNIFDRSVLSYDYITIGSVEDTENKRIIYFNFDNSSIREDCIMCYYTELNKQYIVLSSSQIIGGLNFDKNSLIHSAKISNGNILSWTDGTNNQPRKINIESSILANDYTFNTKEKEYIFPLDFSEITLIKKPPIFTPNIEKKYDSLFLNNFIFNKSFEFAFQYEYYDNEISVVGSYSQASRLNYNTENYNYVSVNMDLNEIIPKTVKIVNLIVRVGDGTSSGSTTAFIVKTWNREIDSERLEIEAQNSLSSVVLSYKFYNDITGNFLSSDDVLRPFDNVPIFSQTHEVSKDRYFLANNIEGYDTPKQSSLQISLGNTIQPGVTTLNLQLGLVEIVGNFLGALAAGNSTETYTSYCVYGTINGVTGYYELTSTIVKIDQRHVPGIPIIYSPRPSTTTYVNLNYRGSTLNALYQSIISENSYLSNGFIQNQAYTEYKIVATFGTGAIFYDPNTKMPMIPVTGLPNSQVYNVFPQSSSYNFGVVFYDYAMRKCGVAKLPYSKYVLFNSLTGYVNLSSPHTIDFGINGNSIVQYIKVGDKIELSAIGFTVPPPINATYDVVSVSTTTITVSQTLITSSIYNCNIYIYRDTPSSPTTPQRDFSYTSALSTINWSLSNINAIDEIPDWAYYYSVVKTLNLRTRFFLQGFADLPKYMGKDSSGKWQAVTDIYSVTTALAIGLNTDSLIASGLGYKYTEGDLCILTRNDNTVYRIPVIGQDGNYILLSAQDISSGAAISSYKYVYEIYSPYQTSDQEPYYEMGEINPIINPTKYNRSYGILNGYFNGDTYLLTRSFGASVTYIGNGMSPNDLYWKKWETDAGKVNIVTRLGKTIKDTNIAWSDTYISGTQINGSSTFRLGNETFVSDDCGSITKLQLTSKVQDQGQGIIMLALCNSEINSMYLGETQITDSTGKTQFFSSSSGVISTINTLKGNYGCINPESVVQYRGKVYFVDLSNGRVIQYSDNGLDAISNIKMSRFWKNWSYKYQNMTKNEIETFGDRPYIFSIVDSGHDELLISIPKLSDTPPKGFLPDYPNIPYPFDILDYQGKTLVYCLGSANQIYPHWQGSYSFTTENFVSLQNRLFSFNNGKIYEHNQDLQNTFYGIYTPSSIMFTSNIFAQVPKVYDNFVVESNLVPNFVYFYNDYPYLQTSDLDDTSFVNLEGIWYANILRNKIVPTATGFTTDGLLTAEVMRNRNMFVQATFSPTTSPLELRLLQLGTSISKGHIIT